MISLWVATSYLVKEKKNRFASLITALPATFMTAVSVTYILVAQEGFKLSISIGYPIGLSAAAVVFFIYLLLVNLKGHRKEKKA